METISLVLGNGIYGAQAVVALLGAFYVVVIWRRLGQSRFRNEEAQTEFMAQVQQSIAAGDFAGASELCEGDRRVLPQLIQLAIENRSLGYAKVRHLISDRFQRDFLSDIDYRMSWVITVIKSAPMLGLFGTVGGMMGAFEDLASGDKIDPASLASNISLALITTVIGLAIAIPLMLIVNAINVRLRKLEDLVSLGLNQFYEVFKPALDQQQR